MDRRESKNKDTGDNSKHDKVTPDDGFIAHVDKVDISQCVKCKNNSGTFECKAFGSKPKIYQFVSYGNKCPELAK